MHRHRLWLLVAAIVLAAQTGTSASVYSIKREMRRMVGYTIIASDSVRDVVERNGQKYVILLSGGAFKLDGLILGPLPASDVIVFARPISDSLKRQHPNLPEHFYYSYKLLIDDEFVDASPAQ